MPGRVFGTARRRRGPARTKSGLPLGSPVRQLGNPGAGDRSDDQMQAARGRAGDGADLLAESIFIDGGRIMDRHEQPTRVAQHCAEVGRAAQGVDHRFELRAADVPLSVLAGIRSCERMSEAS